MLLETEMKSDFPHNLNVGDPCSFPMVFEHKIDRDMPSFTILKCVQRTNGRDKHFPLNAFLGELSCLLHMCLRGFQAQFRTGFIYLFFLRAFFSWRALWPFISSVVLLVFFLLCEIIKLKGKNINNTLIIFLKNPKEVMSPEF